METERLLLDKRGDSLMVGYVLLIVIAIALAILVFAYLKLYLPEDEPECQEDISLTIDNVNCAAGNVSLDIINRGLFSVDGAYIRIGEHGRIVKNTLNEDSLFFGEEGLLPGATWISPLYKNPFNITSDTFFELEVQPVMFLENKPVLCEGAAVSQNISCFVNAQ